MKNIIALTVTLFSTLAFAYPAVNDNAVYTGTYAKSGQSYPVTMKLEVTAFDGSNYTIQKTTTFFCQDQVQSSNKAANEMVDSSTMTSVLANCASINAVAETVTVAAGTFNTCKLVRSDANGTTTTWVGDVPFQVVKTQAYSSADASTVNLELRSFKNAQ